VVSDAEPEMIVAEVDERRAVRRASGSDKDEMTRTEAYNSLIEQLDQLPVYNGVLETPVQGW